MENEETFEIYPRSIHYDPNKSIQVSRISNNLSHGVTMHLFMILYVFRGLKSNQSDPIKNCKLNQIETVKKKFDYDMFELFFNKTAWFDLVCGLYFANRTKSK